MNEDGARTESTQGLIGYITTNEEITKPELIMENGRITSICGE